MIIILYFLLNFSVSNEVFLKICNFTLFYNLLYYFIQKIHEYIILWLTFSIN